MEKIYTPIPVMGTLIVDGVDWLRRLIDSVDYPVTEFVIFNHNGRGKIDALLEGLVKRPHPFIEKLRVVHMPANMGCPAGWNNIIKSYIMAPYWFIVSHDIAFTPGLLKDMVAKTIFQPSVGMVHITVSDRCFGSYEAFIIKDWVVAKYGLFDENFYPAYQEDVDYILRSYGVRWDASSLPYIHGDGGRTIEVEPTITSDKVNENRIKNENYLLRRWGGDWNKTYIAIDNGYIPYDLEFCRSKHFGF